MKKQIGLTLIELMIAMALGLIIIAATMNIYISSIRASTETINSSRLNYDAEMAMRLMVNDIRRAGYWGGAVVQEAITATNPFTATATTIQILTSNTTTVSTVGDCILYSYDEDSDGVVDNNEHYGFRLNNNSLEIRLSGTTTADCTSTGNSNDWEEFIDGNTIAISDLRFSLAPLDVNNDGDTTDTEDLQGTSGCVGFDPSSDILYHIQKNCDVVTTGEIPASFAKVERRLVNLRLTAYLDENNNNTQEANEYVSKSLSGSVKVRNNRIITP